MKRILSLTLTLMLLISGLCCAMAESVTLDAWQNETGWTSFAVLAQDEALADAWDAGAKVFGPALGMEDMTGETLRAMNAQVCGMEDGIVSLTVDGSIITTVDAEGGTVFAHEYAYVDTVENAIEGAPMFVFRTDDADAGKYTYLCLTQPAVASDEGGVIDNFNLRYAEDDYEALFAEDYAGPTCVMVSGDTTIENMEYTIRLIYTGSGE
jgi:hypothetical protein